MFEQLLPLPADPILGLMAKFREDPRANKVDLGVGVYKDEMGRTPILPSILVAEERLLRNQKSKVYVGPAGNADFNRLMTELLFGQVASNVGDRVAAVQTPGGCGALRVVAEVIKAANPKATIWVSDPTWGNHIPLLGNCGLSIKSYPYFDKARSTVDFDAMMSALSQVGAGDLVLLHGCCHNPSGADLTFAQWQAITQLAQEKGFTPFVDVAYQGFGDDIDEDVAGLRYLVERVPEVVVAASCSKNFGLYCERVGLAVVIAKNSGAAKAAQSHMLSIVRGIYSMPPENGAALVASVLGDEKLRQQWYLEVAEMRDRINGLRLALSSALLTKLGHNHFDFIARQKGMFSFLGLSTAQVSRLRDEFAIYLLDSSRASIAGLNNDNLAYVCDSVVAVYDPVR